MKRFLIIALLGCALTLAWQPVFAADDAEKSQKAVLITGASTGLGRVMAETMAAEGYFVYAGARKDKDIAELNAIENVQAIRLDVTKQDEIDAAVKTVREAGRGLYGLINNAGVAILWPLIEVDEDDFHFQMDVNVYGPYRVTKAFAPMIIESKGRISTVGSIAGVLSSPMFGPYAMTKHAMEAFGDALAAEMERFGVHVSLIEPGSYSSKIGKNLADRIRERQQDYGHSLFREEIENSIKWATEDLANSGDPKEVAEVAMHAMFSPEPKRRYMIVPNNGQADTTIRQMLREMHQFNEGQKFEYDRETLIRMLDEVMAE